MMQDMLSGIHAYAGALSLVFKLKLWKYFIVPIIISVVTAISIGFLAFEFSSIIGQSLAQIWIWDWGKEIVLAMTTVVGGFLVLVVGFLLYKYIVLAFSAPFMGAVSEKIEIHINGSSTGKYRKTTFQQQLWRGIKINSRNLSKEVLITIPILVLNCIPMVNIFSTLLLFLVQGYYAGFGNIDYTLERHLDVKESINFVKKHKGFAIGNGIIFMLCLLIPVLGIIMVLPLSVTAASVRAVKLLNIENEKSVL
jgi:CysZ protein